MVILMVKTYGKILVECNLSQLDCYEEPLEVTFHMIKCLIEDIQEKKLLDNWMTSIDLSEIGLIQSIDLTMPISDLEDADNERADINVEECSFLSIPSACDTCFALGYNGICGYCKFTTNVYAEDNDLLEDNRLKDCPFRKEE